MVYFVKSQIYSSQVKKYVRFSIVCGLILPLVVSLFLIYTSNLLSVNADSPLQICVNGKCEMTSDYEGYHNKKTCINENCNPDIMTNSSISEVS